MDVNIPIATAVLAPDVSHASAPPLERQGSFSGPVLHSRIRGGPLMTEEAEALLRDANFPKGLKDVVGRATQVFHMRFFVLDNSGSMNAGDGSKIVGTKSRSCSRWCELGESMRFHADLLHRMGAPAEFRLLNPPRGHGLAQVIHVGNEASHDAGLTQLFSVLETSPQGRTPLVQQIYEVRRELEENADEIMARGKSVAVIITTDGVPTDGGSTARENSRALKAAINSLSGYPVNIVVRLCTDEEDVVEFFNNFDAEIEVPLDVLDDLAGEAAEIAEFQPWLTYGQALHMTREFGVSEKLFDLLDERPFNLDEMYRFVQILFGESFPDPVEPKKFLAALSEANEAAGRIYNPLTRKPCTWINMKLLKGMYFGGSCTIS